MAIYFSRVIRSRREVREVIRSRPGLIADETEKWRKVIRAANIKPQG